VHGMMVLTMVSEIHRTCLTVKDVSAQLVSLVFSVIKRYPIYAHHSLMAVLMTTTTTHFIIISQKVTF